MAHKHMSNVGPCTAPLSLKHSGVAQPFLTDIVTQNADTKSDT